MQPTPVQMEDVFEANYQDGPGIHIGSRTMELFKDSKYEQAYEGVHIAYAKPGDTVLVRNIDPTYITYWKRLMPDVYVINLDDPAAQQARDTRFLSDVVLESPTLIKTLLTHYKRGTQLFVFFPTEREQNVANALGVPLYGRPEISDIFGTKSGIRKLVEHLPNSMIVTMPKGFRCHTEHEIADAIEKLFQEPQCKEIIIKNDHSIGGGWSKRMRRAEMFSDYLPTVLQAIGYKAGDFAVVETWIDNVSASVCADIEITPDRQSPVVRWGWKQIIDQDDGISYRGAAPLQLSQRALGSFITQTHHIATILRAKNAIGSYAPNFIVTKDDDVLLLELNARIPYTAFALTIVQQLKKTIGNGFVTKYVDVQPNVTFTQIADKLKSEHLLITSAPKSEEEQAVLTGVVPFNVGLLDASLLDDVSPQHTRCSLVAMAPDFFMAEDCMNRAVSLLENL